MKLKSALLGASALVTMVGTAVAADLAVKNPQISTYPNSVASWNGLYFSGYGLYGANLTDPNAAAITSAGGGPLPITGVGGTATAIGGDFSSIAHGPGIGGSIGYNWQPSPNGIVFGIRGDLAYANLQGAGSTAASNITGVGAAGVATVITSRGSLSISNATNYLGDIDFIVGLPLSADGRFLGYTGGGFAFGGAKPNLAALGTSTAISDTSTGWNVLAGLAYQVTPNWQLFIEGDYFQLGDKSLTLTDAAGNTVATSLTKYHIFEQKAGVSYKF